MPTPPRGAPRTRARLTALAIACALATLTGCTRLPSGPAKAFAPPVRGATLADWSANGYAQPSALLMLDAMAGAGVNSVTIIVTAYQGTPSASSLRVNDPRTPTAAAVRTIAEAAMVRGLEVALKPHVDLDDGAWRGTIEPADPVAWFESYRAFVLPWARLADSLDAARFVIGTELAGTLDHEGQWRATIAAARGLFAGAMTYAASWDEARLVPFWAALDLVGVDFYFPVAARANAGRFEILTGWTPWLERLQHLHDRTGKRILLTEIGYRSIDGAGQAPYAFESDAELDLLEQADLYWAALEAVGERPWMEGLDWWNYLADGSGGAMNGDYTPFGKPAALELGAAWNR